MKYLVFFMSIAFSMNGFDLVAQEMITDRPDQTESSSTVFKGSFQIESGLLLGFSDESKSSVRTILAPTTLFRVGLTRGIELRVVTQYEQLHFEKKDFDVKGFADLEVGTKIQLLRPTDGRNIEVAFLTHLIIPSGSSGLTNDAYGSVNKLAISHTLTENLGLGYNVGYNYLGEGQGDLTYSMALGLGMTSRLSVYAEAYGEVIDMSDNELNMDMGLTYLVKENVQLDWSFGTGINHEMNYMSVGVSWNIRKSE